MTTIDTPNMPTPAPAGPKDPTRSELAIGWARTHLVVVVALCIPLLVFGVPQLFGQTYLDGDNLIQNLPMRLLVGKDLFHGVLPLWNPYLFSGTPLLGGFNAGGAYPVTWLTAVLPLFTAWTITLVLVYDIALAGMYLFLRRQALSVTAATIGAITFAFAGYMTGQLVHIDLIEGAAWLPWIVLAIHALTDEADPSKSGERRAHRRRMRRWAALLGVALGLTLLAGAAESIIDSGVLVAIYWVSRLITQGYLTRARRRALLEVVGTVVAAVMGGVALGAAQWLPGLVFLSQSQRAATSYSFFTSGSLNNRLVSLLVSPFILGSNQGFPVGYAGPYNFPEVTSYAGILALIAACSLFLRKWRTRPEARQWWVWYVVLVVGLLSALGNQTPFAHLMYLIPGMNSERLLNRNLLLVDFSLAVIVAWWVHLVLEHRGERDAGLIPVLRRWRPGGRAELVATCAPVVVMAGLCLLLWTGGPLLGRLLEIQSPMATTFRVRLSILVTMQLLIAGWATWVVLHERRYSTKTLGRLLTTALVIDLALFNFFVIRPPITEAAAQANTPAAATFTSLVGDGRFIIYDPDRFDSPQLFALGQTDFNIYHQLPSAQGYTALTDGRYFDATGAHLQETLNPASMAGATWDQLNVTTLLSLPGYFLTRLPASSGASRGTGRPPIPFPSNASTDDASATGGASIFPLASGQTHRWYFGGVFTVERFSVPLIDGGPGQVRVGLVTTTGGTRWLPTGDLTLQGSGTDRSVGVEVPTPVRASGLVVQALSVPSNGALPAAMPATVGIPTARTIELGDVALNGRMQAGVTSPHWVFTGTLGPFGVFHNSRAEGWATLRSPDGGAIGAGTTVRAAAPDEYGNQRITVHTDGPAVLVRSVSATTGWHATIRVIGGAGPGREVREAAVQSDGIIQSVALPRAGEYLVTFTYAPRSALVGLVVSAVAVVLLLAGVVWELSAGWRTNRKRSERSSSRSTSSSPAT